MGVEDLSWTSHRHVGGQVVEVTLARAGGGFYHVRVGVVPADEPRALSCNAPGEERPATYSLLEMNKR